MGSAGKKTGSATEARATQAGTTETRTAKNRATKINMTNKIDFSALVPMDELSGEDEKDTRLLRRMGEEAKQYLLSFQWCKAIENGWFGYGVGEIVAVFLFEIVPATVDIDKFLWV